MIYVVRNGKLVEKDKAGPEFYPARGSFPTPRVSRFETMASPIDDAPISSWRQRDRDMAANDCFDPRDLKADHVYRRGRVVQFKEAEEVRAHGKRTDDTDA